MKNEKRKKMRVSRTETEFLGRKDNIRTDV
jgi:hypothetical protein